MRLIDLMPRWVHPKVFTFLCPHCQLILLSCKTAPMDSQTQWDLFDRVYGPDSSHLVVPCDAQSSWVVSGEDFANMTVSPSLDASKSGHWHGFISQGIIA